jgi:hypothetical protein
VTLDEAAASVQEVPLDEVASIQNITNNTKEGMSETYSSINTFSQLLVVIFSNLIIPLMIHTESSA